MTSSLFDNLPAEQRPAACVFDLDGTLVDSLPDIAEALNECLELLGLPPKPVQDYRYMVGEGIPMLCRRAIGETHPHLVDRLAELARACYRIRPVKYTRPYPGVSELVERLRASGVLLGVLSNKPHELTVRVVNRFWPDKPFAAVQGYVEEHLRKPDPTFLLQICERLGMAPGRTWLIGDTPTDAETARNAGTHFVGVTWGFRTLQDLQAAGAKTIVDRPEQIAPSSAPRP